MLKLKFFTYDFIEFILSLLRILIYKSSVNHFNLNTSEINILGNGPSLSKDTPGSLESSTLFSVNYSINTEDFFNYKPSFHGLFDPIFCTENDQNSLLFQNINKINWNITIYCSRQIKRSITPKITNSHIKIKSINNNIFYSPFNKLNNFIYRNNIGIPQCQNILVFVLYVAITGKAKKINLYGADHDWMKNISVDENNNVILTDKHFYGTKVRNITEDSGLSMSNLTLSLHKTFKGYEVIQNFALSENAIVHNLNPNSFIDCFKKELLSTPQ